MTLEEINEKLETEQDLELRMELMERKARIEGDLKEFDETFGCDGGECLMCGS